MYATVSWLLELLSRALEFKLRVREDIPEFSPGIGGGDKAKSRNDGSKGLHRDYSEGFEDDYSRSRCRFAS